MIYSFRLSEAAVWRLHVIINDNCIFLNKISTPMQMRVNLKWSKHLKKQAGLPVKVIPAVWVTAAPLLRQRLGLPLQDSNHLPVVGGHYWSLPAVALGKFGNYMCVKPSKTARSPNKKLYLHACPINKAIFSSSLKYEIALELTLGEKNRK